MIEAITLDEYHALVKQPPKYGNDRIEIDGWTFDSKAEAARYQALKLLLHTGAIADLRFHPTYELQAAFTDARGLRCGPIRYEADFAYTEISSGRTVVEDVKGRGVVTAVFRVKEKLFRYRYPELEFRVIFV